MILFHSDCLEILKTLPENSIDSLITDPPAGISFMGKEWDSNKGGRDEWIAWLTQVLQECHRVLKPGAHALVWALPRTSHWTATAVEDAGFEIRDIVMHIFGCLSEDTEILTLNGWERYHKDILNSPILCYDKERDAFEFYKPTREHCYQNTDIAYRIQSDFTDQIVSWNHRVLVERGGRKEFIYAETCEYEENIPFLESLSDLPETICYPNEGTSVPKQVLLQMLEDQKKGNQQGALQDFRKDLRGARTTKAKVTPTEYSGRMWCVTVPTGAFVARRNGKIFITGNTGFPKSQNIAKTIDKQQGFEGGSSKTIKVRDIRNGHERKYGSGMNSSDREGNEYIEVEIHEPQSEEAKEWQGWGTNLKPAAEHWILARKPISEGSITANVLKWGTGAINIDECRVSLSSDRPLRSNIVGGHSGKTNVYGEFDSRSGMAIGETSLGRFPSHLIHDGSEEVLEYFPQSKGQLGNVSGKETRKKNDIYVLNTVTKFSKRDDEGSAARFFYCSKASKQDRDEGLKEFEEKKWVQFQTANGTSGQPSSISEGRETTYRNRHPTVKNTNLMRYLCRLITLKNGVILDPFMGSGSTGKAAILEGFDFIGIEKEKEYFKIAEARIEFVTPQKTEEKNGLERFFENNG